jgi:hypothetical protein
MRELELPEKAGEPARRLMHKLGIELKVVDLSTLLGGRK